MFPFNLLKGCNRLGGCPLMDRRFAHIRDWIFDLDNCLYPANSRLFELIDRRMTAYIERLLGVDAIEARRVQKMHFHGSGTTLAGLMKHHDVDPRHFDRRAVARLHAIELARTIGAEREVDRGENGVEARGRIERVGVGDNRQAIRRAVAADARAQRYRVCCL